MTFRSPLFCLRVVLTVLIGLACASAMAAASDIERFVGQYSGSAEIVGDDGTVIPRDMSVSVAKTRRGFSVEWATITHYTADQRREKSYEISFVPSDRPGVFSAAMTKNVFGHEVQLDPMKGEPYVWARITGDTLTVFSLFVDADGGYELQQFDRTLANGGLDLTFTRIGNGKEKRTISAFLEKLD